MQIIGLYFLEFESNITAEATHYPGIFPETNILLVAPPSQPWEHQDKVLVSSWLVNVLRAAEAWLPCG